LHRRSRNDDFDIATASMLNLSVDSKGYGVKNPTSCVLDLVCLTSLSLDELPEGSTDEATI